MLLLLLGQFQTKLGKFGQNWASFYFNIGSYWAHNVKITVNFLNSNIVVIEFSISFRAPHIHWEVSDTNFKLDEFFRFFWQLNSSMFISSNIFTSFKWENISWVLAESGKPHRLWSLEQKLEYEEALVLKGATSAQVIMVLLIGKPETQSLVS